MPNQTKTNLRRQPRLGGAGILQMCRRFIGQIATSWRILASQRTFMGRRTAIILASLAVVGLFGLTSALLISADLTADSYAVNGASLDSEVRVDVDGNYYVSLAASDATFSVAPGAGTQSSKTQVNLSVETNALGGAGLYLSMSGQSSALFLDGNTASTSKNIAAATTQTTYDNMSSNTWGYSTDDVNFQGVPTVNSPTLLADVDGVTVGTSSEGVTSATIPVYYAAKVDTSIPSGSYANSVTYLAVVDGGITTSATLTKITVDNQDVEELQADKTNVILVTTNLKTKPYGTPRVYYKTTDPSGYAECGDVVVSSNEAGYMTVQCSATPTQAATGVMLHIVPKGGASDIFCTDGTYPADSSECEAGDWKWGNFIVTLPDIVTPGPDINRPATSWDDLEIMQHMTPEICASASVGETKQLIDWRDGKTYWVARLKDGSCWMTQNLELDLAGKILTPADSDVATDWNYDDAGGSAYTSAENGIRDSVVIQYYNFGKYVWKSPSDTGFCGGFSVYNFSNSKCQSYWQDVSNWTSMTEYRTDGVTYDVSTQTYDAHYLVGNYYSWNAATANSIGYNSGTATQSICPKGFKLPPDSGVGSYSTLIGSYGIDSDIVGGTAMRSAPLFFVRSGFAKPTEYLANAGYGGYYWSSVACSTPEAYSLSFASDSVNPLDDFSTRPDGYSVRCVAPSV